VLICVQVIASEGERAAAVNRSEAQRCQFINNSEGERQATVNFAEGKAQQIVLEAQGRAQVVNMAASAQKTALEMFVSAGLSPAEASRLSVALRYVDMLPTVLAVSHPTRLFFVRLYQPTPSLFCRLRAPKRA
jgi:regulator of protease activity HflC (stomatin/prohibitin superfamily)